METTIQNDRGSAVWWVWAAGLVGLGGTLVGLNLRLESSAICGGMSGIVLIGLGGVSAALAMVKMDAASDKRATTILEIISAHELFGRQIRDAFETSTGKRLSYGALYTLLARMEDQGLIVGRDGEPDLDHGGYRRRFYSITEKGQTQIRRRESSMNEEQQPASASGQQVSGFMAQGVSVPATVDIDDVRLRGFLVHQQGDEYQFVETKREALSEEEQRCQK